VNRTDERALKLAQDLGSGVTAYPWSERQDWLAECGLVVNTTTQGMTGNPPLELALDKLAPEALVADIVYTPLETPLLAAARARGNQVIDGLGMLLHQARPAFARWFGRDPEVDQALRDVVIASLTI
jgi:shikimate dehydrogenase